jgi:host factor-I protein
VLLENNSQEQLIFKHAISTVVSGRAGSHLDARTESRLESRSDSRSHASSVNHAASVPAGVVE